MVLTKDCIAEAAVRQIQKKGPDKITVKDIVEACSMTRQTFYYYFDDIPDLLLYLVQCRTDGLMRQAHRGGDLNEMLEGFVRLIDENDDFIRKLLNSRYHDIVDQMLFQFLHDFLFELMENELDMFLPKKDREFFICYHCFAIKDILIYWRKNNHISTEEAIAMVRTVAAEKAAGRQSVSKAAIRPRSAKDFTNDGMCQDSLGELSFCFRRTGIKWRKESEEALQNGQYHYDGISYGERSVSGVRGNHDGYEHKQQHDLSGGVGS